MSILNLLSVKLSKARGDDVSTNFYINKGCVENAIYLAKYNTAMPIVQAARYYVEKSILDEKVSSFYVLSLRNGQKNVYEITRYKSALESFVERRINKSAATKEYDRIVSAVMTEISDATKGSTVVGYTTESDTADKFANFEYSPELSNEELDHAWNLAATFGEKDQILAKVLGNKYNSLTKNIHLYMIANNNCFQSLIWRIVKHQLQYDEPIHEKLLPLLQRFENVQRALTQTTLNGLNFASETQLGIIQKAAALGSKPDGTEYIDEFRSKDCWLGEEEMLKKYNALMTDSLRQQAQNNIKNDLKQYQKEQEILAEQRQEKEDRKLLAKAPLQAQLARLKVDLAKEEGIYMKLRGTGSDYSAVKSSVDELRKQVKDLEDQIRRIDRQ